MLKKVWLIMGSDSDLPQMATAASTLDSFLVPYEITIASAHRSTDYVLTKSKALKDEDFGVVIAAAGLAAHLPGVIAAATTLPVIGVPLASGPLQGTDALYAIVQMPPGVPVATVAINGAKNAAILAAQILSVNDSVLALKLEHFKEKQKDEVLAKNAHLQKIGIEAYLAEQKSKGK